MPYKQVLPIAYEIDTFSLVKRDVFKNFVTYRGKKDNGKDIGKRCQIMCNAIDIAYAKSASHKGGRSANTLKLFMAPEFYFRGKEGAYPLEVIAEIMPKLREHTKAEKFANWLFIFGTALGRIETTDNKYEILNVALVQKGGVAEPDGVNERIIYKEYISAIDFAGPKFGQHKEWENPTKRSVNVAGTIKTIVPVQGSNDPSPPDQSSNELGIEYSAAGMKGTLEGRCVFVQDGVCIALEVCRDHLLGRLKKSPPAPGNRVVQLHLITSAGAFIKKSNVSGRQGTVAFNVDGGDKSELRIKTGPNECSGKITAPPPSHYPISLKGAVWWIVTHKNYFGGYGSVVIYPCQSLPAEATTTV